MGRHSPVQQPRRAPSSVDGELMAWAVFVAPLTFIALGVAGAGWWFALAVGALMAVVFAAVAYVVTLTGASLPRPGEHGAAEPAGDTTLSLDDDLV